VASRVNDDTTKVNAPDNCTQFQLVSPTIVLLLSQQGDPSTICPENFTVHVVIIVRDLSCTDFDVIYQAAELWGKTYRE